MAKHSRTAGVQCQRNSCLIPNGQVAYTSKTPVSRGHRGHRLSIPATASLQRQLSNATSSDEVLSLVDTQLSKFDRIHLATALHRVAHFAPETHTDERVQLLLQRVHATLQQQDAHGIANVLWASAKLQLPLPDAATLTNALQTLRSKASACKPQALCNSVWALGTLSAGTARTLNSDGWKYLREIVQQAAARSQHLSSQELSTLLWGAGRVGVTLEHKHFVMLFHRAQQLADEKKMEAQEAGMVLWAFATMHDTPTSSSMVGTSESHAVIARHAVSFTWSVCDVLDVQASAIAAWAFGVLRLHPGEAVLSSVAERYVTEGSSADPVATANLLWGFSKLGVSPGEAVLTLGEQRVQKRLHSASVREISALLSAFAELKCEPSDSFLSAACAQLERSTREMQLDDYFETLRSLPRFGIEVPGRILQGAYECIESFDQLDERSISKPQLRQAINAMMQLAHNGFNLFSDGTLRKLFQTAEKEGRQLGIGYASGLVQTMAASEAGMLPTAGARSNPRVRDFMQTFTESDWDLLSTVDVARTLRALSFLRAYPGTPQLDHICQRVVQADTLLTLDGDTLTTIVRAMAGLHYNPRESHVVSFGTYAQKLASMGRLHDEKQSLVRALWIMGAPMQLWRKLEHVDLWSNNNNTNGTAIRSAAQPVGGSDLVKL